MNADRIAGEGVPKIELRRGGWFVMDESPRGWSGPWRTERAAELARDGDYDAARAAEKERDL